MNKRENIYPLNITMTETGIYITELSTNGVYKFDKSTSELSLILPKHTFENKFMIFNHVIEANEKIIYVPRYGNTVLVTDINGDILNEYRLPDNRQAPYYYTGKRYKDTVVMLPCGQNPLILLDSLSGKITEINIALKEGYCVDCFANGYIMYISCMNSNRIIKLNMRNFTVKEYRVKGIQDGIDSFCKAVENSESSMWFTRLRAPELYYYDGNNLTCYNLNAKGSYMPVFADNRIFLFARQHENVLTFDMESKSIRDITDIFEETPINGKAQFFRDAVSDTDGNTIWAINSFRGVLYKLDAKSMTVKKFELTAPDTEKEKIAETYISIYSEQPAYSKDGLIIPEFKGLYEVEGYLEAVIRDIDYFHKKNGKYIVSDTNIGKNIHEKISELWRKKYE